LLKTKAYETKSPPYTVIVLRKKQDKTKTTNEQRIADRKTKEKQRELNEI
jgi:hypothetical protein